MQILCHQSAAVLLYQTQRQIGAAIAKKNIPRVKLEADENGYAMIDKDKHPEIYDWVVNGFGNLSVNDLQKLLDAVNKSQ